VEGDVWYFPTNVGHAILGLSQGCSYVAAYNRGDFDELKDGRGLSNWLSTAPLPIVAQARTSACLILDIRRLYGLKLVGYKLR
jgi:hypothetical protein